MITIYYPRINYVTLDSFRQPATMQVSSRSGLNNEQYRELAKDINRAVDFIELLPTDFAEYKKQKAEIEQTIDDFNASMSKKWRD